MEVDRDTPPYPERRDNDDRYPPPLPHGGGSSGGHASAAAAAAGSSSRARYDNYDYPPSTIPRGSLPPSSRSPPLPQWGPPSGAGSSSTAPSSSRHHHSSSYPSPHYSYPYPYPPPPTHTGHSDIPPPPPPAQGWGQWAPPYATPVYSSPTAASSAGGSMRHLHSAPPGLAGPSPPPPASPSQIQRLAPPPPASAPSPPRSGPGSSPAGYLPGFQPDYDRARVGETLRPPAESGTTTDSASAVYGTEVRPPPTEAYLILRPHRMPRGGWSSATDAQLQADSTGWTYRLEVLQAPERGKALGVEQLRRGWPPLTPPLIAQLHVTDQDGNAVPTDNAALARRLVHLTMSVELVEPDTGESRSMMRVRPPSRASSPSPPSTASSLTRSARGSVQPYYPSTAPPPFSLQRTLLGSAVRTAQVLTHDGRKGLYFIFQDMIVRPEGRYALEGKILDLAGPPHIGTSIGVTHPLAFCRTGPFDIIVPQEFPGPVPITTLSAEFLRQGERHLGRRPRNEDGETEEADDDDGAQNE